MARYFVSDARDASGSPTLGTYWRAPQGFGRFVGLGDSYAGLRAGKALTRGENSYHTNLSLLAHAVGDRRERRVGPRLMPAARYEVEPGVVVDLGPFATVGPGDGGSDPVGLPIANKLRAFLDDPLDTGRSLDLGLPFFDEDVVLGLDGGWLRDTDAIDRTVHGGVDFSTRPRRLFGVAAAQAGTVVALLYGSAASQRGLVIEHPSSGDSPFRTIYQHLDEETVTLAVGDRVAKGQELGHIVAQIQADGDDLSHLHFGVGVCGPEFTYDGVGVGRLWYLIDPFGVYDYRTDDTTYVPRTPQGMWLPIRGAERRVQWSSIVPAEALPVERLTDSYETIERIQVRVRRNGTTGELPPEHDQFIIWLPDESMFFVPLRQAHDAAMETVLAETLRDAFMHGKKTRLGYRFSGSQRLITAAWIAA